MKKIITILVSLILALVIAVIYPQLFSSDSPIKAYIWNEKSLVQQEILSYSRNEKTYYKIYTNGRFIGVVHDLDYLYSLIDKAYEAYEPFFPNTELGLSDDIYVVEEKSYAEFSNVDDAIMDYLQGNNLLGVKTTAVEFSTGEDIYEIIYVRDYAEFSRALERFYTNFISEEALLKLMRQENIPSPTELGSVETHVQLYENINTREAIVSPDEIFTSEEQIYNFLCYGRNTDREYYTVQEGDTLQGVGYYFGDMSARQIRMLNPDVLLSENQVIVPGMQLNVTYYTSPITIEVTRERLSQQFVAPETPEYIEDNTLERGKYEVRVQEETGIKNVLYEEKWVNGVLESGELLSETVIKQPKRGVIAVGTKQVIMVGTGNYIWPVDNPRISCHFGCYFGHTGTDLTNRYEKYAPIYAVDSGVVDQVGYRYDMGNYIIINHQNGVRTMYMHLNKSAYFSVGENVHRGDVIGQMGNTGRSEGVHLHLTFEVNGIRVDPCRYLPCSLID